MMRAGRQAVVFVNPAFERAARTQAKVAGVPELKIYVYPQYKPGSFDHAVEAEKARRAAAEFPALFNEEHKDANR